MAMQCRAPVGARSAFLGQSTLQARRPVFATAPKRAAPTTQALFGLGGAKKEASAGSSYSICVDCGWIYPDAAGISKAPASFKCPACNAPKSKFKPYKGTDVKGKPNNTGAAMKKRFAARQW